MSWGSYTPHTGAGDGDWDRVHPNRPGRPDYEAAEPSGFVTNDPYAPPSYNEAGSSRGAGHAYYQPPYQQPRVAYGPVVYSYSTAHPPRPSVGPVEALTLFFKNYANFYGRASRTEFWWMALWGGLFTLVPVITIIGAILVDPNASDPPAFLIPTLLAWAVVALGTLLPNLSLQVRRLHDAGFSGLFTLIGYLVPYVGWVAPMVMSFFPSTPNGIRYDNPDGSQPAVD
jgi:uncharacterized membrane protein YhaH (DUF805 family)